MVSSYFVFLLFAVLLAGWNHVISMYLLAAATFFRWSMKNQLTTCDMYCDLTILLWVKIVNRKANVNNGLQMLI